MSENSMVTVEPLGVVLRRPEGRQAAQTAVDDRVATREVDDRGGIQLTALGHHGRGVVAWVVRAASHTVHLLQHITQVTDLERQIEREKGKERGGEREVRETVTMEC